MDFRRAQREVKKIADDLENRKRKRQEYKPVPKKPEVIEIEPIRVEPVRYIAVRQPKSGFSKKQACFLVFLTIILTTICICGGLLALPSIIGPPSFPTPIIISQSNQPNVSLPVPPPSRANNQTRDGLVFTAIRLSPYVPDYPWVDPGPGNWWRLEVSANNPSSKPLTLRGYDLVLRDAQNREYWYDQGQSMFGVKNGLIEQLNPGTTVSLSVVFNLPDQLTGLTLHYDGAAIPITEQNIVR